VLEVAAEVETGTAGVAGMTGTGTESATGEGDNQDVCLCRLPSLLPDAGVYILRLHNAGGVLAPLQRAAQLDLSAAQRHFDFATHKPLMCGLQADTVLVKWYT
jgi:hypothetical protein